MADVKTFYPGGTQANPIAVATEADTVDDQNSATNATIWTGTTAQYNALKQTGATTSGNPSSSATVQFTVTSTAAFTTGATIYVTGTSGNTTRTTATVNSIDSGTQITVGFNPVYTSAANTGYQLDIYDANTLYFVT
jgi:hypothetical protein